MRPKWSRLRDCFSGRDAVLNAGSKYVPDLKGLDIAGNTAYRQRGNFYNAVKRTVQGLTGVIFQKAPEVKMPEPLKSFLDDVTSTNVTFEMFSFDAGQEAMLMGRMGVLIDMAAIEAPTNRPYLCSYLAESIINWRTVPYGGEDILTLLILREVTDETDEKDSFVNKRIEQYRECRMLGGIYSQQLWRESDIRGRKEWVPYGAPIIPTRRGDPLTFIPFVFIGSQHATTELDEPPLTDLADTCLAHWRNSVDHEYGLHLTALPTPWVSGAKGPQDGSPLPIGPSKVWELELQGQAGMLEFTGAGLKALAEAMAEKKKQMAVIGARMLEDVPNVDETATAVRLRRSGENASLRTVANAMEQAFTMILQTVVWWQTSVDHPRDAIAEVGLNKEYANVRITAPEVQAALQAVKEGKMSFETWWNLLTTGGWGREGIDAEAEKKEIDKDTPEPVPAPLPAPVLKPGEPGYVPPVAA